MLYAYRLKPLPPYPRVGATYVYDQLGFCSFTADQWVADLDCGMPATHRHPFCLILIMAKPWAGFS